MGMSSSDTFFFDAAFRPPFVALAGFLALEVLAALVTFPAFAGAALEHATAVALFAFSSNASSTTGSTTGDPALVLDIGPLLDPWRVEVLRHPPESRRQQVVDLMAMLQVSLTRQVTIVLDEPGSLEVDP
ncbi:MAG: hypothetical protein MK085_08545 [Phycisphaerales bacterium]|nr:hypothetical protein [Phycisphaerales bacterium]